LDKASLQLLASRSFPQKVAIRKEMLAERSVWLINLQPDPDGRFALHLALQEECAARTECMRIMKLFMKLILHTAPPEEDPGSDRVPE
jgi:hypothetical protein